MDITGRFNGRGSRFDRGGCHHGGKAEASLGPSCRGVSLQCSSPIHRAVKRAWGRLQGWQIRTPYWWLPLAEQGLVVQGGKTQ